ITVEFTSDFTINTTGWDITVSCVSLSTNEFSKNEVSVYPNPVDNLLNISSKTALSQLIIYDIKGKIVSKKSLNQELDTKMDLGSLGSGVYFIKLISENSSIVKRVIKR
ncbi:MAG: T9SS type A sorting domain-containing protein, partial [Bacteroidetes bacterium]|nr:T9SS type A sorting domain-containing protein [Bacteroidota bacterium]